MANEKQAEIDEEVKEEIAKKQVDLGLSDEKQMRRTELNFYCELLSTLKGVNDKLDTLYNIVTIVSQDKIVEYFRLLDENVKAEEARQKTLQDVEKSHLKPKKSQKSVAKS